MPEKSKGSHREVFLTRDYAAPRERVFEAWSKADHLAKWFAPRGCEILYKQLDFRPGGKFHSCIKTPDGKDCWCIGEYRQIDSPSRIVFTMSISDAKGKLLTANEAGMDSEWPQTTLVTIHLENVGGGTRLTLHQTVDEALAKRTGAHPSWINMLDRLAELMATKA